MTTLMQTWKNWGDIPPILASAQSTWRTQMPQLALDLFDDDRMLVWLQERPALVNVDKLRNKSFIRVVDLFRYAYLFVEGGMYADLDFAAVRPTTNLTAEHDALGTALLGSVHMPPELQSHSVPNAWMYSPAPGHPLWLVALALAAERIEHPSIEFATGPELLLDALEAYRRLTSLDRAEEFPMWLQRFMDRLGTTFPSHSPGVAVLPETVFYPVSWSNPDHQPIRDAFRTSTHITRELMATVPLSDDTVAFTFWYNSWTRD